MLPDVIDAAPRRGWPVASESRIGVGRLMVTIRAAFAVGEPLRQFAAVPIGLIVGIEVMVMGSIAGAAMNPARAFGPYVFLGAWQNYWIYALGPLIGILAGGLVWDRLIKSR